MERFTVTGPDVDRKAESASIGLSAAVSYASRWSRARREGTYYVRDAAGEVVGRADADGAGSVTVYGEGALREYRVRQIDPSEVVGYIDRATTSGPAAPLVDGRPGSPRRPTKEEEEMTEQKTRAPRRKSTTTKAAAATAPTRAERPSEAAMREADEATTREQAAAAKGDGAKVGATRQAATAKGEKGTDLLATLLKLVEEQVPGMKRAPNKSQTYTRLQTSSGKTFAYIFPPRDVGLAVKIPKQLLEVEGDLPKGHGFKTTGWGLTRTITKASEAPVVARSFAVAAARLAPAAAGAGDGES